MELRLDDEGTHTLFGNRDENLRMLEDEFGVKISSRGGEIFVQGKPESIAPVEKLLGEMQDLIEQGYPLKGSDVSTGVRVLRDRPETNLVDFFTDDALQAAVRRQRRVIGEEMNEIRLRPVAKDADAGDESRRFLHR